MSKEESEFLFDLIGGDEFTLGKFFRALRKKDKQTLKEFGDRLGISRGHISNLEHDRVVISARKAAEYATTLGVPERVLLKLAIESDLRHHGFSYRVELK